MKQIHIWALSLLILPLTSFANAELMQIVAFSWDKTNEKLTPFSFGSGTAIDNHLVLTNKHVVRVGTQTADFVLLCPAQTQQSRAVECNVAAGVSALHSQMDLALVRTLNTNDFLPSVRTSTATRSKDDIIRIVGFPVPDDSSAQNFGGTKTVEAFETWMANPEGGLDFKGDTPTTTRGKVLARYTLENTGEFYTQTDARVNFGNSGGAAFDQFGNYIGIPTLKDSLGRSYILEYGQMHEWVTERSGRPARVEEEAYEYYKNLVSPVAASTTPTTSSLSARMRYFQLLRQRQSGISSENADNETSERRTTSRVYSSPYRGYSTYRTR